ncbi:hypothetical protein BDZ89DRAFT_760 [Hymenopellis radicata]|nr:hypothetical protein BDZ89DRAFT_760 [Hymenopellis radicata]
MEASVDKHHQVSQPSVSTTMANSPSPFVLRLARICNSFFYGIGIYGYFLQLGQLLSLIPPQYEEAAKTHIRIVSQAVATGSYAVLMFWLSILFIVGVAKKIGAAMKPAAEVSSAGASNNTESAPAQEAAATFPIMRFGVLLIYCICGIVNDTVINRAKDSPLVEGGLDRMSEMVSSSFDIYLMEICWFNTVFFVVSLFKFRAAYRAARRARAEQNDLEGQLEQPATLDEKVIIVEKDVELIFDVEEDEKPKEKN